MSIFKNLYIGTSGIGAHGGAIGVVGDNIANVSTIGFKSGRADFADVLGGRLGGSRLGNGVKLGGPQTRFGQGSIQQTGGSLDMAIGGRGFFVLSGSHKGQAGEFYSRDGRFALNSEGLVVNPRGLRLQGYPIAADGTVGKEVGDLNFGEGTAPPSATTSMDLQLNLDASAVTPALPFDPLDPENTSNYSTSVTVYDSLGGEHRVDMHLRASGAGTWEWHAMVDGGELTGGTAGVATEIASGALTFNTDGALDVETALASSADFVGATPGQAIAFDFGDAIATDAGTGLSGTTQFAGPSNVNGISQDGFGFGSLVDLSIGEDGTIEGVFSNGQTRGLARIALAGFTAEEGLERSGDGLYSQSSASGQALVDAAGVGNRGSISAGSLEASNVDLGGELVTLIAYQRAFQANVRTVTTADEMLAETANMKR